MHPPLYFDNNATTLPASEVTSALKHVMHSPLNPSARHRYGQTARALMESARIDIAKHFSCHAKELIWTSGATEGLNLTLRCLAATHKTPGEIVTSAMEHTATLQTLTFLENQGWRIRFLPSTSDGLHDLDQVKKAITPDTKMIVLMACNNETGVIQPVEQVANLLSQEFPHIDFIVDAVAAFTKMPLSFYKGVRAMVFSGHKFHALGGSGFALMRNIAELTPFLFGGGQEYGVRCGTVNMAGVLSLHAATSLFISSSRISEMTALRNRFEELVHKRIPDVLVNGALEHRCANTSNLYFPDVDAESLLIALERFGIYASQGSACASGLHQSSHVLRSMGFDLERLQGSIRFSFSRYTTSDEITQAVEILAREVKQHRCSPI